MLNHDSNISCLAPSPSPFLVTIVLRLHASIMRHVGVLPFALPEEHGTHTSMEITVTFHLHGRQRYEHRRGRCATKLGGVGYGAALDWERWWRVDLWLRR